MKLLMTYLVYESHGKKHGPTILGETVIKSTFVIESSISLENGKSIFFFELFLERA